MISATQKSTTDEFQVENLIVTTFWPRLTVDADLLKDLALSKPVVAVKNGSDNGSLVLSIRTSADSVDGSHTLCLCFREPAPKYLRTHS
jgi:hypothetical protein